LPIPEVAALGRELRLLGTHGLDLVGDPGRLGRQHQIDDGQDGQDRRGGVGAAETHAQPRGRRLREQGQLPRGGAGASPGGQMQSLDSLWKNAFTARSSREWKEITTSRPPGPRSLAAASRPASRLPSSSLTAIRRAWKVLVAGWMSRGQARLGMAASTARA